MIDYDPHDWRSHFWDIRGSMLREILVRVSLGVVWAAVIVVINELLLERKIRIPATGHTLVGAALGLLLVFRTNSSYARFWEGRRMWGSIVNESRNLARLASVLLRSHPVELQAVVHWTIAFAFSAMNRLRGLHSLGDAAKRLPADEVSQVQAAGHTPLAVATRITAELRQAQLSGAISDYLFAALDQNVQQLIDYLGACERIHTTPLPFAYVVHLRRALLLFIYTLPFALVSEMGWWTIPATMLIAFIFMGIEEIGVEIEAPFGTGDNDLPLDKLCRTIERDLLELLPPE